MRPAPMGAEPGVRARARRGVVNGPMDLACDQTAVAAETVPTPAGARAPGAGACSEKAVRRRDELAPVSPDRRARGVGRRLMPRAP